MRSRGNQEGMQILYSGKGGFKFIHGNEETKVALDYDFG
jgi:hypothetical protein